MDWFRHYAGASFDPKFRTVARIAGTTIERVVFVFWAMCEHAGAADDGGSITRFDAESTADHLGCNVTDVTAIVTALQGRVHDGKTLTAWTRRQYVSDHSADRVRRWRERQKQQRNVTVTPCNVTVTDQNRTEQSQNLKKHSLTGVEKRNGFAAPNGAATHPPKKSSRAKPRTPIPDDWEPGAEGIAYAHSRGMRGEVLNHQANKFIDRCKRDGSIYADWPAAWRTWVRNWVEYSHDRKAV